MKTTVLAALPLVTLLASTAHGQAVPGASAVLTRQVFAAESSFAATMAYRDSTAFATFVAPDAVFFGDTSVLRGKHAVVDAWRELFAEPAAPFSWKPEKVEVLASGTLAHTSGPVFDAKGQKIGNFNSIWRREPNGSWLVVFDKVCPVCDCRRKP
jgi:ketosteroid isomerase-like protein